MPILVSELVKQHRDKYAPQTFWLSVIKVWIGVILLPLLYLWHSVLRLFVALFSGIWKFTYHPIGAYVWLKMAHVAWAMLLAAVNDVRCRGTNSIIYPECKITIHAQSLSLHELFESKYIVIVSIVRLLHACSYADVADAIFANGLAYFKLFELDISYQFMQKNYL
jgi:hypothetical protein